MIDKNPKEMNDAATVCSRHEYNGLVKPLHKPQGRTHIQGTIIHKIHHRLKLISDWVQGRRERVCVCVSNQPRISHSQQGECRCGGALQGDWGEEDLRGVDGDLWEPVGDGD